MARKLRGFERVLDAPSLFAVAYGEIASSLYIALGIVAAVALGLTPLVLLLTGALFFVVSLSYAEGTAAIPETGGAATFVRRASNDLAGFLTGWALFLDFLIVMALSALFVPHYVAEAISVPALRDEPWDAIVGCGLIAAIAGVRLTRRTRLHVGSLAVAMLDLGRPGTARRSRHRVPALARGALRGSRLRGRTGLGGSRIRAAARDARVHGLETVANLAEEAREPGRTLPRSLFSAIGLVVVVTVLIAGIGLSAFPVSGGETALGEEWLEAPLVGIAAAFEGSLPALLVDALRIAVGISGALILVAAATTSVSGITRLSYSLAGHGSLPREFGRLERRALVSSEAILIAAGLAIALIVVTEVAAGGDPEFLAAIYSFGVLIAFTAAQLAVIRLRMREPALVRPFRARPNVSIRGVDVPVPALVGAPLTAFRLGARARDARGRSIRRPALAADRARGLRRRPPDRAARPPGGRLGGRASAWSGVQAHPRPDEARATSGRRWWRLRSLSHARPGAEIEAITVVRVPRRYELEGELPPEVAARVDASLEEARVLGVDQGVEVRTDVVRARSIGHAIVDEARSRDADLVVLGLRGSLEASVALLLADGRLRAAASPVRSSRRRVPRRRVRGVG